MNYIFFHLVTIVFQYTYNPPHQHSTILSFSGNQFPRTSVHYRTNFYQEKNNVSNAARQEVRGKYQKPDFLYILFIFLCLLVFVITNPYRSGEKNSCLLIASNQCITLYQWIVRYTQLFLLFPFIHYFYLYLHYLIVEWHKKSYEKKYQQIFKQLSRLFFSLELTSVWHPPHSSKVNTRSEKNHRNIEIKLLSRKIAVKTFYQSFLISQFGDYVVFSFVINGNVITAERFELVEIRKKKLLKTIVLKTGGKKNSHPN